MVCGLSEALTMGCDIGNNFTLIIEIIISVSLALGLPIYFYKREQIDRKKQDEVLDKQSKQISELTKLTQKQSQTIDFQQSMMNHNRIFSLTKITQFLENLQNVTKYFMGKLQEPNSNIREKYFVDPTNRFKIKPIMDGMNFRTETGLELPTEAAFEEIFYLIESTKNLFNHETIIELREILTKFKNYYKYDEHGNITLLVTFGLPLVEIELRNLDRILNTLNHS